MGAPKWPGGESAAQAHRSRGGHSRWIATALSLALLLLGAALAAHLLRSPVASAPGWVGGLGVLRVSRVAGGVLLGAVAAMALIALVAGSAAPTAAGQALFLALAAAAAVLVATDSPVVVAFLAGGLSAALWLRWQRVVGPQLVVRSVARQGVMVFSAWLAAAALLPGVRTGSSPPALVAILLALGLVGLMGVMPFSSWVSAAVRLDSREMLYWRVLLLPAGALLEARAVALSPALVATPLRELLIALGLATALFWGGWALLGPERGRYPRALACDAGLVCLAVALGTVEGLTAAFILVALHWLAGAVLSEPRGQRSRLVAWVGLSGLPPFGGFSGRLLVVLAAVSVSPVLAAVVLLVGGLQLGAAAAGMRSSLRPDRAPVAWGPELLGLAVGLVVLALGVVPVAATQVLLGFRP